MPEIEAQMTLRPVDGQCCVLGCERDGLHDLQATITVERIGMEDSTVDAWLCCEHFDMLTIGPPYVYLTVSAYIGQAA
jgi:hypothetical protein